MLRRQAVAESMHLRLIIREHGALPNCQLGRLPYEALERWFAGHDPEPSDYDADGPGSASIVSPGWIARRLHMDVGMVHRWRRSGTVTPLVGDRLAIRLGTHPVLIWPYYYDITVPDPDEIEPA